jgi:hypothetical protein
MPKSLSMPRIDGQVRPCIYICPDCHDSIHCIVLYHLTMLVCVSDNIFNLRTWANRKLNVQTSDFDKNFGIPGDFDYLDPEV